MKLKRPGRVDAYAPCESDRAARLWRRPLGTLGGSGLETERACRLEVNSMSPRTAVEAAAAAGEDLEGDIFHAAWASRT